MFNICSPNKAGDELLIQEIDTGRWILPKERTLTSSKEELWAIMDLGGTYPIGEIVLGGDQQNRTTDSELIRRKFKDFKIEHSMDKHNWTPVQKDSQSEHGDQFFIKLNNALARYIKLSVRLSKEVDNQTELLDWKYVYNLRKTIIYAGRGLAVVPSTDWTNLFHRKEGWSGADGIYSIPFNGCERQGEAHRTKTMFVFGDTFIGDVDSSSNRRCDTSMVNNTLAILKGGRPKEDAIQFLWNTDSNGNPASYFVPTTEKGRTIGESYYWLQDGISIKGTFYCFPMLISPDPTQPEGFEFKVNGVACVSAPIGEAGPILEQQTQLDTPFYYTAHNGKTTYFGASFMAQTEESQIRNPDGFIYVYGLQKWETTKLVVARVLPHQFTDFTEWKVWDGENWTREKEKVVPIAEEVSSELSVSPMLGGYLDGKFIIVFQEDGTGKRLGIYVGDSPVGPFGEPIYLYYCSESESDASIYTYNAKGHPHLSNFGELLVSYNVNTSSWPMHEKDSSIYRPKFLTITQFE
ncbi:hypothetical protein J14TS2_19790 [Bacillus sp. J14TS2]|uniref:DUF4185 domain-containing protein n=1 Tax=Bacillus sp. J14TS2 TaxID=2807188 RepID=UPI001AFE4553|nr:DUF4185 domain-containing protein [Bacillus sp. J14TS2]GIN71504.1 hypothetical protein J14TS2_19790 [Bacillus sp. J14TS2]